MDLRIILDIIAITSALYSTALWFANHQIKIGLEAKIDIQFVKMEAKIDRMMQTNADRTRRQSDGNKVNIALLKGEVDFLKSIIRSEGESCIKYNAEDLLPEEETGFA